MTGGDCIGGHLSTARIGLIGRFTMYHGMMSACTLLSSGCAPTLSGPVSRGQTVVTQIVGPDVGCTLI